MIYEAKVTTESNFKLYYGTWEEELKCLNPAFTTKRNYF